jgi:glycosyltransferase involved in cell wall biosynthesis
MALQSQAPPPPTAGRLKGKRVGMVTFSNYPFDPRVRRAVSALVQEGAKVELISLGGDNRPRHEILPDVEVMRIPLKHDRGTLTYLYSYGAFILVSSAIFAFRAITRGYDFIYVNNMPDILVISAIVPKALGAKVALDLHDPMPELMVTIYGLDKDSFKVRVIRWLEKWSMARANLVLTVNRACKRIFSNRSCPAEKIGVVMNAPDSTIFPFRDTLTRPARASANQPFIIMYHGSLVERNGVDLAVDALAKIRKTIPHAELRIYGHRTPFLDRVLAAAEQKGVGDIVRYLGPKKLEELVVEIQASDVGVIPNQRNLFTDINTPTRIFEYLALGTPVIAPSTLGIQDYFEPDSMLFFEPGNSDSLAQRIQYVFDHPAEVRQTMQKAQAVYLDHTWDMERQTLIDRISQTLEAR